MTSIHTPPAGAVDDYEREMQDGRASGARGDWTRAYRHFLVAHELGHALRQRHLATHRAALAAAWRGRRTHSVAFQAMFLGFAFLTAKPGNAR